MLTIRLKGEYARFTRADQKSEGVSYPIPTASALIGALRGIYWKPEMDWRVTAFKIMRDIQMIPYTMNHLDAPSDRSYDISGHRMQRRGTLICNPDYIIQAEIVAHDGRHEKHVAIAADRIKQGACFSQPYLGCRECGCDFSFAEWTEQPATEINRDFGLMPVARYEFTDRKQATFLSKHPLSRKWEPALARRSVFHAIARNNVVVIPSHVYN